jgi:peptidase E
VAGEIVVSGGAGFWCGPSGLSLDRYVLSLVGRDRPRVCALATASGDSKEYLDGFYDNLGPICEASHLALFLPPVRDPADALLDQDVVYVGGGSTANMLVIWRLHGVDEILREANRRGVILYGSSAGGLCWFESGVTDSLGFDGVLRPLTNGLGFIAGSHSPHFDQQDRRDAYVAMVKDGRLPPGVGVDEFAAVHFVEGHLLRTVSAVAGTTSHLVRRDEHGLTTVTPLTATGL